MLFFPAGSLL